MTPRRPGPPAHKDPDRSYPAHEAKRSADLIRDAVQPALETLEEAAKAITESKLPDEKKRLLLLDYMRKAHAQVTEGRQLAAEYAMRSGLSQSLTAQALTTDTEAAKERPWLAVSHDTTNRWWHRPLAADDLTK
ncbi:hypothetical protein [uncultured Microbacterium sp.]|uniref:hypothetical protein n=1 Tax=uncultured Microbacterium sp. TaxID=191216 RepID=UPI0028EEEC34|nr:hypothetical protein [uncultured Microbacterium sp.]